MKPNQLIPLIVVTVMFYFSLTGPVSALTKDESNNIEIYRMVSAGVVNITSVAVAYDSFYRPIPKKGTGSGVIIGEEGYIVTMPIRLTQVDTLGYDPAYVRLPSDSVGVSASLP